MNDPYELAQLQQQMVELQSQLAFQEDTISALNQVVTRQQRQIEHLNELCMSHKSQLELLSSDAESSRGVSAKPPHY